MVDPFSTAWYIIKEPRMVLDGMEDKPQICPCGSGKATKECCPDLTKARVFNLDNMPPGMDDEDDKRRHFQPPDDSQGETSKNKLKNRIMRDALKETEPPVDLDSDVAKAMARMSPVGDSKTRTSFSHGPGPRRFFGSPRASERVDRPREASPMATTGPVSLNESLAESLPYPATLSGEPEYPREFLSQGEAEPMTMRNTVDTTPMEHAMASIDAEEKQKKRIMEQLLQQLARTPGHQRGMREDYRNQ
tara:strand:+ start:2569 stop:3312 length:744 start_codon:yes stop_codon:yes gene_type:complete